MSSHLILYASPWGAIHCWDDWHHARAKAQFAQHAGPFMTCEAMVAKTCFLLACSGFDPCKALTLIERCVVKVAMSLAEEVSAVRSLFERYENVPVSLAHGCLVRMLELYEPCGVITLNSDFHIYRRHGQKVILVLTTRP